MTLTGDGSGQLILGGTNSYGGGTYVEAGTLIANNSGAIPDGSSLTVGAGGVFIFDPTVSATPNAIAVGAACPAEVAAVPEPGTLALLLVAALWSAAACRRFAKRDGHRRA